MLAALHLGVAVDVQGTPPCPPAAEVTTLLDQLLGRSGATAGDIVHVAPDGPRLRITLEGGSGIVFRRSLPRTGTCSELAEAVAVIVAAWKFDRHPELDARAPVGVPAAVSVPGAPAVPRSPPATPWRAELGAGTHAGVDARGLGPGLDVTGDLRGRRLGLRLHLAGEGARAEALAGGTVTWRRLSVALGPTLILVDGAFMVDVAALAFAGMTTVDGRNFPENQHSAGYSPGAAAGLRVGRRAGPVVLWAQLTGRGWLFDQRASVAVAANTFHLSMPTLEGQLAIGLSVPLTASTAGGGRP